MGEGKEVERREGGRERDKEGEREEVGGRERRRGGGWGGGERKGEQDNPVKWPQ